MRRYRNRRARGARKPAQRESTITTAVLDTIENERMFPTIKAKPRKREPAAAEEEEEEEEEEINTTLMPPPLHIIRLSSSSRTLTTRSHKVKTPMPGTPCSTYGCQKNEYGLCTACGRIQPWLERPPGYFLGWRGEVERKREVREGVFGEVDRLFGGGDGEVEGDGDNGGKQVGEDEEVELEEVRIGLEGL